MKILVALGLVLCLGSSYAGAEEPAAAEPAKESKTFGHRLLFWIPNRVFDVFDIVRLRVRVGPGFAASVRATEVADVTLGAYGTLYAGIHGPRARPEIPWPIGLETLATAEVSVAQAGSDEGRFGPQYGPTEIGVGFQAAIIGLDIGVEPWDVLDFAAGILTFDPKGDDF
jgi:hypothetical protein